MHGITLISLYVNIIEKHDVQIGLPVRMTVHNALQRVFQLTMLYNIRRLRTMTQRSETNKTNDVSGSIRVCSSKLLSVDGTACTTRQVSVVLGTVDRGREIMRRETQTSSFHIDDNDSFRQQLRDGEGR